MIRKTISISLVVLAFVWIFGTAFVDIKEIKAQVFPEFIVPQGGTGFSSTSPNTLIASGPTATSSLMATSTPTFDAFNATSTATSTIVSGLHVGLLNVSTTTATSTFANGIQLSAGCYLLIDGTCAGAGGGLTIGDTITGGAINRILFEDPANLLGESATFIFDGTNFGIGTTSPGTALSVSGDGVITGTTTTAGLLATSTVHFQSADVPDLFYTNATDGVIGIGTRNPDGANGNILFRPRLHIFAGDSGGAATCESTSILCLEGSNNVGLNILAATNRNSAILFGDGNDNDVGKIVYDHGVGMELTIEGTTLLNFTSTAINPISDSVKDLGTASLFWDEIFGDEIVVNSSDGVSATAANEVRISGLDLAAGDAGLNIRTEDDTDYLFASRFGQASTTPWGQFSIESVKGVVGTDVPIFVVSDQGTSTPFLYVSGNNGNIGIGTSSPITKLHIGVGAGVTQWYNAVGEDGLLIDTDTAIGRLSVVGDSQADFILQDEADAINGTFRITNQGGNTSFQIFNDAFGFQRTIMTFDNSNGNVGIGTTTPGTTLSISGNGMITGITTVSSLVATSSLSVATTTPQAGYGFVASSTAAYVAERELQDQSGGTLAIDWSQGNQQSVIMTGSQITVTMSNWYAGASYRLVVCQDAGGGNDIITWPSTILWAGGATTTQTTAGDSCDVFSFIGTNGTSSGATAQGKIQLFGAVNTDF